MHSLQLGKWIASLALLFTVGCSYPHVYCAPDNCEPCNPDLGRIGCADCGGSDCEVPCGKPARGLFTHLKYLASCGGGCGEIYIHPWINERPDECDPCNNHGDWTGPGNCSNRGFWKSFWGDKCCDSGCGSCTSVDSCGCDSCAGGMAPAYHGPMQGEVIYEGEVYQEPGMMRQPQGNPMQRGQMQQQPTPAEQPPLGSAARRPGTPTLGIGTGVQR
jgi:hypothetical protein